MNTSQRFVSDKTLRSILLQRTYTHTLFLKKNMFLRIIKFLCLGSAKKICK